MRLTCLTLLLLAAGTALAAPRPLDDAELAAVDGGGIGFSVSLALNAGLLDGQAPKPNLAAGFRDGAATTYLVLHGLGGRMDLHGLTLNVRERADGGGDAVVLGLPIWGAFEQFGVRGLAVQDDATTTLAPSMSLGGAWLQGNFTMQGRLLMWAR